jgi:hypothetical protein
MKRLKMGNDTIEDLRRKQEKEQQDFIEKCPHDKLGDWEVSRIEKRNIRDDSSYGYPATISTPIPVEEIKRCKRCNKIVRKQKLVEVWQEVEV